MTIAVALAVAGMIGGQPSAPTTLVPMTITLDNSYPTGGYPLDIDQKVVDLGLTSIKPTNVALVTEQKSGYVFEYDRTNKKLKVYWNGANGQAGSILQNLSLSAAGLAIGSGSKAKVKITNTVTYLIAALFKSKTTAEVAFTATTHDIPANAGSVQERVYVLTLDAAGTPTITAGVIATGSGQAAIPAPPANQAVIGYVRVAVAAGATPFDASSDNLDAAHLTVTYTDAAFLPSQQLTNTPGALAEVTNGTDLSAVVARVVAIND